MFSFLLFVSSPTLVQLVGLESDVASLVQVVDSASLLLNQHMAFFLHMPQVCRRMQHALYSALACGVLYVHK